MKFLDQVIETVFGEISWKVRVRIAAITAAIASFIAIGAAVYLATR
jgi:flagellar biosynthesis/type III secretory pathway protein FliH